MKVSEIIRKTMPSTKVMVELCGRGRKRGPRMLYRGTARDFPGGDREVVLLEVDGNTLNVYVE